MNRSNISVLTVLVSLLGLGKAFGQEDFGQPVVYANNSATVMGQVSINGDPAGEGDVVAIYAGEELRGKQVVSINQGVAWLPNALVNAKGGEETISFKVYDASTGVIIDNKVSTAMISPGKSVGSFTDPFLLIFDTEAPVITLLGNENLDYGEWQDGGNYQDPGATAMDNLDGDLTDKIEVSGEVNVSVPGVYKLTYTVTDAAGNVGKATRTVTVSKKSATVSLGGLNHTYDGSPKSVNVNLSVEGLSSVAEYSDSDGNDLESSPTDAGTYAVLVYIDDIYYEGSAKAELTIEKAEAEVVIVGTRTAYDGTEQAVTVTTNPSGLTVEISYAGSEKGPIDVGEYQVVATVSDKNYQGSTTAILQIVTDPFGIPVVYPNNTFTVLGSVTIDGVTAGKGDVVAVYVGDELRGKQTINVFEGVAYLNLQVYVDQASEETSRFVVWDADQIDEEFQTLALKKRVTLEPGGQLGAGAQLVAFDFKTTVIQEVALKKGWNLVSFYVEVDDMSPAAILEPLTSIGGQSFQIKSLTRFYDSSLPYFLNTMSVLNIKDGYWVKVNEDVSFEVEGVVPESASIRVRSGWNLVGYPRESGETVSDELQSLGDAVVQIKNLTDSYEPPPFPPFLNTLSTMVPGLGYWLKVSENGTWTVGDVSGDGSNGRGIMKASNEEGPEWEPVEVYPNLSATVLGQVSLRGKAVSSGSVVGVFVGDELRGMQEVVQANGMSYVTLNVNLKGAERANYRIWDAESGKNYRVVKTMTLEMGGTYGSAAALVKLDGLVPSVGVRILSYTRSPFGLEFESEAGREYVVEATGDLKEWKPVQTLQGTSERIWFTPEQEPKATNRYFRVRIE